MLRQIILFNKCTKINIYIIWHFSATDRQDARVYDDVYENPSQKMEVVIRKMEIKTFQFEVIRSDFKPTRKSGDVHCASTKI